MQSMGENEITYLLMDQENFEAFNKGMIGRKLYSEKDVENWTAEDYNLKIIDILEDVNLEFYKYYMDGFDQVYYVFGLPNWVVIVGENGIMETAFEVDRKSYNDYLNLEDGILV